MQFHITSLSHRPGNQALKFSSHNHRRVKNGKVCNKDSHISLDDLMGGDREERQHVCAHIASLSSGQTKKQQAIN